MIAIIAGALNMIGGASLAATGNYPVLPEVTGTYWHETPDTVTTRAPNSQ